VLGGPKIGQGTPVDPVAGQPWSTTSGVPRSRLGTKLELRADSSHEDAQEAAEQLRLEWSMGNVPAEVLVGSIERELGARVLFVDAPPTVSGAALHLPGLHTILVNRGEPSGRRNFDIAHWGAQVAHGRPRTPVQGTSPGTG